MLTLPPGSRVFVATERTDGRKGIDGLSAIVRSQFAEDPLSGSMYVFFTRRADRVRVLYFDRDGYVLLTKRLEKGSYRVPFDRRQLFLQVALPRLNCYSGEVVASRVCYPRTRRRTMKKKISPSTRDELVRAIAERYRAATHDEKLAILDEFVAVTGYHRKHAIRVLNSVAVAANARRPRLQVYDDAVRLALIPLWEASDRVCGKRLKPLLSVLVPSLERHGHLQLDDAVRAKLLNASAATIDRLLAAPKAATPGKRRRSGALPTIRRSVPVRTFGDWKDPPPGYMEIDLVSHGGGTVEGSFVHTLTLTDIATGWTECLPLLVRDSGLVVEALARLRPTMPFPLRGVDTDNGSEFINEALIAYCKDTNVEFTRSRLPARSRSWTVECKRSPRIRTDSLREAFLLLKENPHIRRLRTGRRGLQTLEVVELCCEEPCRRVLRRGWNKLDS